MPITEVPITLANLADGAAEEKFDVAFTEIAEAFTDPRVDGKKGKIVLTIEVSKLGDGILLAAVKEAKVVKPALKAEGRMVRIKGGVGYVDVEEVDEIGTRALFPPEAIVNKKTL